MSSASTSTKRFPPALYALTVGSFGIGTTEFVIMGLLLQVAADLHVSIATAGLLISGYALGVFFGAPLLTVAMSRLPRKLTLLSLMVIFTLGNLACALAPSYEWLMLARVITSLAHGTFFGVGAVVATKLVAADRRASAISIMFTGLTVATLLGVPAGAWLGLQYGWRTSFWAVTVIGLLATAVIAWWVPADTGDEQSAPSSIREDVKVLARPQVLLGLLATVLGFSGVFAVFTYIQPLLTKVSGFADATVSMILLVFGVGMIAGNLLGGRLADKRLVPTLLGSIAALAVVQAAMSFFLHMPVAVLVFVGLLGMAAFAIVSPLQLRVLQKAEGVGQGLASSLNIAAFNLGNALGAWVGGLVITHGPGLEALPWVAALLTVSGGLVAGFSVWLDARPRTAKPGQPSPIPARPESRPA